MDKLVNFALFQLGWFACVLLGATDYYYIGPLVVIAILLYHLKNVPDPVAEKQLMLFALLVGLVWENLLVMGSLLVYPKGQHFGLLAPVWIIAMWPLLAITLNSSLRYLKGKTWLALAFGALGGPLAFLAGERLGAVHFPDTVLAITVLGLGWSLLFPLMVQLAMRYDGYAVKLQSSPGGGL